MEGTMETHGKLPQKVTMEGTTESCGRDQDFMSIRLFNGNDLIDCSGEHQPIRILLDP